MQPRFRPYGWASCRVRSSHCRSSSASRLFSLQLGIIKGAKIHVDFATMPYERVVHMSKTNTTCCHSNRFDEAFSILIREIEMIRSDTNSTHNSPIETTSNPTGHRPSRSPVDVVHSSGHQLGRHRNATNEDHRVNSRILSNNEQEHPLADWNSNAVSDWLRSIGLSTYVKRLSWQANAPVYHIVRLVSIPC
jgi:hypothetical protein